MDKLYDAVLYGALKSRNYEGRKTELLHVMIFSHCRPHAVSRDFSPFSTVILEPPNTIRCERFVLKSLVHSKWP